MRRIAIITARAGSKGLPDKNMLMVDGKPLMAYSIEPAIESGLFDSIILTTDSQEYIDLLSHYPITPVLRPAHLALDTSTSYDVLEHVIQEIGVDQFDYFVLLQPTSPMRTAKHLREACGQFEASWDKYDFCASVVPTSKPTVLTKPIEPDGSLKHFNIDYSRYRRQDQTPEFSANGVIYIAKGQAYLEQKHFYGARSMAYFMDSPSSLDIDNREDFEKFYFLIQQRNKERNLLSYVKREIRIKGDTFSHPADISFIGDSLLALWDAETLAGKAVQNVAIQGITAPQYRSLILNKIQNLRLSPTVILSLGRSDIRHSEDIESIFADIQSIVSALQARTEVKRILLLECLPALFRVDCRNAPIQALNQKLQSITGIEFIKLSGAFSNKYGKLDPRYTHDGFHLNEEGYQLLHSQLAHPLR